MKMKQGEGGVTLIELAVVMAIVGIMALFLAPAISTWVENFRIKQASREMSSDLQFAKMKAISTRTNCAVVFDEVNVGGTQYAYVIFPDYNNDLVWDTTDAGDLDGDGDQENETNDAFKLVLPARNVAFDTSRGGGDGFDFPVVSTHPAVAFNPKGLPRYNTGPLPGPQSVFLQNTKNNKGQQVTITPAGSIGTNEY
jgi:prepilin-type N-terminal cleavage/methylation domain-containing protein